MRVIYVLLGADHPANVLLLSDNGFITGVVPAFHKTIIFGVLDPGDLLSSTFVLRAASNSIGRGFQDWRLADAASLGAGIMPEDGYQRSRFGKVLARMLGEAHVPGWPGTSGKALLGSDVCVRSTCLLGAFVRMPLVVNLKLRWLHRHLSGGAWRGCGAKRVAAGEVFRIDAKAEGSDLIVLGGWFTGSQPDKRTDKWFSTRITKEQAPWAFEAGDPCWVIASLELFLVVPEKFGKYFGADIVDIAVATVNLSN